MTVLMGTKQFKMYLDDDLVSRLEGLAQKGGRRSAQQVAEEILEVYWPVWSAVTDAMNRSVAYQIKMEQEAQLPVDQGERRIEYIDNAEFIELGENEGVENEDVNNNSKPIHKTRG